MAEIEKVIKACKYAIGDMIKRGSCSFTSTDEDGYRYVINWAEVVESLDKIGELQNQIPKWHLVADGDLPKDEEYLNSKLCWDDYRERCVFARYVNGSWIMGNGDESVKVIAWTERPKFEGVK